MESIRLLHLTVLLGILLIRLGTVPCLGQQSNKRLADIENLQIDSTDHRQIYYEQRLYRNPLKGMLKLNELLTTSTDAEFIPLFQGVPMARYRITPKVSTKLISRTARLELQKTVPFNRARYKLDFRIQPEFIANFGYREKPLQSKTNLLLQSQFYIRRGLVLNWGILFPLVNDLDAQELNIRPAPVFLNQFMALDQQNYLSASVGLFYTDRYGLNVQYRHSDLTKPWSFGVETGLTGVYYFPKGGFTYSRPSELLLVADVAYRLPVHAITLKVSGGQYLYQDRGVRVDFVRQFTNVEIGFYAMKTGNGSTGGFNFAIPIPPGRIAQTQHVRLRSTEEFRWEYSYTRGYEIGLRYKVGYQLDALLRQYHQGYLSSQPIHN